MSNSVILPEYLRLVKRVPEGWSFGVSQIFYKGDRDYHPDLNNIERKYGLTKKDIIYEIFRLGAGKCGYYLVNLKDKKYYYCGINWKDIKITLISLGIGREDPLEI